MLANLMTYFNKSFVFVLFTRRHEILNHFFQSTTISVDKSLLAYNRTICIIILSSLLFLAIFMKVLFRKIFDWSADILCKSYHSCIQELLYSFRVPFVELPPGLYSLSIALSSLLGDALVRGVTEII